MNENFTGHSLEDGRYNFISKMFSLQLYIRSQRLVLINTKKGALFNKFNINNVIRLYFRNLIKQKKTKFKEQ